MLLDARQLSEGDLLEADVCIVGGGAAGITLALELADSALSVILLESGDIYFDEDTQALASGDVVGFQYDPLDEARLRFLGGTTNHWTGYCMRLSPIDFESREGIPHSGWPITYNDLAPFYDRAQPYMELHTERPYDAEFWAEKLGLQTLAFDPNKLVNYAVNLSAPTLFGLTYEDDLRRAENLKVFLNANALEIDTDDSAAHVTGIKAACIDGPRFRVEAKRYVLAMGGIEIPRLLLLSNSVAPNGLGNTHGLVGRFFSDHFGVRPTMQILPSVEWDTFKFYTMHHYFDVGGVNGSVVSSEAFVRENRMPAFSFHLFPHGGSPGERAVRQTAEALSQGQMPPFLTTQIHRIMTDLDGVANGVVELATDGRHTVFDRGWLGPWLTFECVPNPDSTVYLIDERDIFDQPKVALNCQFTEQEMQTVKTATEVLADEFGRLGLGRVWTEVLHKDYDWPDYVARGKHHCGTTRMSADPRRGVVDASCRVHGIDNLYISSSSVFPTNGYANPTVTIVAMAIRMADEFKAIPG